MSGAKILIAEDDSQILRILQRAFETEGYDVLPAKDGKEALDIAQASKPAVVLSDVWMPRMDGVMFVQSLRESLEQGYTPRVILMSAYEQPTQVAVDAFVPKPFDLNSLLDMVENLLPATSRDSA
jgi:CheY-like chemotaxis protein